jgi:hypothetical protein
VAPGYEITSIIAEPATVAIQGDVQTISNTVGIDTDAIFVTGLSQTFTQTVQLKLNNVSLVDAANTTSQVRVDIAPIERPMRMRLIVPIEIRDVPEGFVFVAEPGVYVLDALIDPEALRRNTIGLVQAFVSVGAWDSTLPGRQVQVLLPANIRRESELSFVNVRQIASPLITPEPPLIEETATVDVEAEAEAEATATIVVATATPTVVSTSTIVTTTTPTPIVGDN